MRLIKLDYIHKDGDLYNISAAQNPRYRRFFSLSSVFGGASCGWNGEATSLHKPRNVNAKGPYKPCFADVHLKPLCSALLQRGRGNSSHANMPIHANAAREIGIPAQKPSSGRLPGCHDPLERCRSALKRGPSSVWFHDSP